MIDEIEIDIYSLLKIKLRHLILQESNWNNCKILSTKVAIYSYFDITLFVFSGDIKKNR